VGLILDLAVLAIALVVVTSLALLTWTIGVSSVRAVHHQRDRVADARRSVARTERRILAARDWARRSPTLPEPLGDDTDA
jgi:hypothetical protein